VAGRAFHRRGTAAARAALDVHRMAHARVELQRRIARDVAVLAARVLQHGAHGLECGQTVILRSRFGRRRRGREKRRRTD